MSGATGGTTPAPAGEVDAGRLAVFSAANDAYVPAVVVALRSFQKKHPEFDYFVFADGDRLSDTSRRLLDRHRIELVDLKGKVTFETRGRYEGAYPSEAFFRLAAPQRLADRGFDYSLYVDGDVYCNEPLPLARILTPIEDFAARPVGTLLRTLRHKQSEQNVEYDFSLDRVCRDLHLTEPTLRVRHEYNNGVIFWNNRAMKSMRLLERCVDVFERCNRCLESDQDLLAFVTAMFDFRVTHLRDDMHFTFFQDSTSTDLALRLKLLARRYQHVHIVHFVFLKPWKPHGRLSRTERHFVNRWRQHTREEFGGTGMPATWDLTELS